MNSLLITTLFAWSANFNAIQEKSNIALNAGQIKDAESHYQNFLKEASLDEKGIAKSHLAILYYKDQEHEKAFRLYLDALKEASVEKTIPSNDELVVYEKALQVYLNHVGNSPDETALKIRSGFASTFEKNPHYYQLGFLLAVGEANLGYYEQFFEHFYSSYRHDPHHFLSYKTQAALHIKLFERAKTDKEREEEREQILKYAKEAVQIQPHDSSIYRMIMGFTSESLKSEALTTYLNKIIDQNIVVSRIDIPYYVEIAIAFKQYDLAQKFLDKTKQWYSYSRVINVAQEYLDEQRSQK